MAFDGYKVDVSALKIVHVSEKTTVAQALIDPDVVAGKRYFRAQDLAADDGEQAVFRVWIDPCWSLVGVEPTPQLLKLVTERYWKTDVVPRWDGLGGKCSIAWLPTEAVYVEPDEVSAKAPVR